jgi:phage tail tape-measure protein
MADSKKNPKHREHAHVAHPVGVGAGAASVGLAGAALGAAVAGPVGAVVGAAVGAVAGGLGGNAAAEGADLTAAAEKPAPPTEELPSRSSES